MATSPPQMTNVLYDYLPTDGVVPVLGEGPVVTTSAPLTWPQNRWLIGWSPWIGVARGTIFEGHLILLVNGARIFLRGRHKEVDAMYDVGKSPDFFPFGYGVFVPAGTPIALQLLATNTGTPPDVDVGVAANAMIFSVPA